MFAVPLREIVRLHASSPGATGAPIAVGYTRNDLRHWTECMARLLASAGVTASDVVQVAFPHGLFLAGFGFHQGAEQIGASVIPSSAEANAEKQTAILRDFKTTALISTPSHALRLAREIERMRACPEKLRLRIGLLGGEPWPDRVRAEIEERLRITSLDSYGLSDVMGPGVAGECLERQGLHVNEDHFIVEAVDPVTLAPVPRGTPGELVFTTITREGFPIIRYRTGDWAALLDGPCRCGRTFARVTRVTERTDDRFFLNGVGIFPAQVEGVLAGVEGASPHYQVLLDREAGADTMEIRIEVSEKVPALDEVRRIEGLRDLLARRIETALDVRPRIAFVEPRSFRGPDHRKVVDKRPR
jgi:phenylacetate-CoA ligase